MDSYKDSIFEPLEYYRDHAKAAHKQNIKEHFDLLVNKSGVDIQKNKDTVSKYYAVKKEITTLNKKLKTRKLIRVFSIVISVVIFLLSVVIPSENNNVSARILFPILAFFLGACIVFFAFRLTKKSINSLEKKIDKKEKEAYLLRREAEAQMAPLCEFFSDDDTLRLIEKTLPQVKFDSQFLFENLEDLRNNYGFNNLAGEKSSALDTLSGKLYKNPFLFERCKNEGMSSQTYTGTLVIRWTEYGRDSKGRTVRQTRYQTLVASVVKPKPIYNVTTLLSYGSQAAPDLTFARENKHFEDLTEKEVERTVKKGEKKLKKKADKALSKGNNFTEMSNTKFDVLFDATNRDNEQQFRLLFTPLAQREMLDLIRSEEGYGDDFDFFKRCKINVIRSEHSQSWNMSTSASRYYSFDFEEIKKSFEEINTEYFKSVYFDFAPLIAIPSYQEPPRRTFEDISHRETSYTEYNYESIANKMGTVNFAHPRTATDAILKSEFISRIDGFDTVAITAHSYSANNRIDHVPTLGGDGKMHLVPVPWIEYLPLQKTSLITIKGIGLTEDEYIEKIKSNRELKAPKNAVCYKGLFGFFGTTTKSTDEFIKNITK